MITMVTCFYNEADYIPFYLKHYAWADWIFAIVESTTTDNTRELLKADPRVLVMEHSMPEGKINDLIKVETINIASSMAKKGWIIAVDSDEFVFSATGEPVPSFLARQPSKIDVVFARIWQVYKHETDSALDANLPGPIVFQRRHGDPNRETGVNKEYCKPIVLRTDSHETFKFSIGNHSLVGPVGMKPIASPEFLDGAHWSNVDLDLSIRRRIYGRKVRFSQENLDTGRGIQDHWVTEEEIKALHESHLKDPILF